MLLPPLDSAYIYEARNFHCTAVSEVSFIVEAHPRQTGRIEKIRDFGSGDNRSGGSELSGMLIFAKYDIECRYFSLEGELHAALHELKYMTSMYCCTRVCVPGESNVRCCSVQPRC